MSEIEERLHRLGYRLPAPMVLPPGIVLPFPWVRVHKDRAFISGHAALNPDGTLAGPFGKVGRDLTLEQAFVSARLVGLSILASLQRALGDLDRVTTWLKVLGMVNSAPGFDRQPGVINGFTELIVALWGPERGLHARTAVASA